MIFLGRSVDLASAMIVLILGHVSPQPSMLQLFQIAWRSYARAHVIYMEVVDALMSSRLNPAT